jgi:hypothetical protein
MNCLEFRQRTGAEPGNRDPELLWHRMECRACAEFVAIQQQLDAALEKALRVPVPQELSARILWRATNDRAAWRRWAGMAATVLLGIGLGFGLWTTTDNKVLASEVIAHVQHEPQLLLAPQRRAEVRQVSNVMSRGGVQVTLPLQDVSHAGLCPFRGRLVPHLVFEVDGEPVSVLLLPHEPMGAAQEINEEGFIGMLVPVSGGSMAIVAGREELIVPVREELERKVKWGI